MRYLSEHHISIALLQPQIAPNTGNIARLCVATKAALHLIRPMGFVLSDRELKRSAMDYWPRLNLKVHDDAAAFFSAMHEKLQQKKIWLFTSKSNRTFWEVSPGPEDCLLFGSETSGLPQTLLDQYPEQTICIPQTEGERCLNLSTAVGIGLYRWLGNGK